MIPLRIAGATHVMNPPGGKHDVRPLIVRQIEDCFVSRWEPTPGELAILNAGGSVELWVIGHQPPVALTAVPAEGGA